MGIALVSPGRHVLKLPRRTFLHLAAGTAALPAISRVAWSQTYPARPITMIVAFPAGGPTDVMSRVVAERMKESLGRPIIIENVSGADGSIGVGRAGRAKPDGYTINIGTIATHVMNGAFYSLKYDLLNDFVLIALLGRVYIHLVHRTVATRLMMAAKLLSVFS